jgi:hypothetical protein
MICNEYSVISTRSATPPYDQWRDQWRAHAAHAFATPQHTTSEARLAPEDTRLKTFVGELTLALNKSGERLG